MEKTIGQQLSKHELRYRYDEFAPNFKYEEWVCNYIFGLKRLRRQHFGQAAGKVLDVATGTGVNFGHVPRTSQITAVDLSPGMLDIARARARKLGLSVTFRVMDAEALDFPNDTFDSVISSLATCTFPHPLVALGEMARVCKPGGRILLLEHGCSSWRIAANYQNRKAHQHYAQVGCRWNQDPLAIVQAGGLVITRIQRHCAGLFYVIQARPGKDQ